MGTPLQDGVFTPRYVALFALGVAVGAVIRLGLWVLPGGLIDRLVERLLPSRQS
jgi:hypothetical protein